MKKRRTYWSNEYLAFNKDGIGGILVYGRSMKAAEKRARELWGRGATAEFVKKTKITKIPLD